MASRAFAANDGTESENDTACHSQPLFLSMNFIERAFSYQRYALQLRHKSSRSSMIHDSPIMEEYNALKQKKNRKRRQNQGTGNRDY
jgi:hypothetical protein